MENVGFLMTRLKYFRCTFRDPNKPVSVEQMKGIKWPSYDAQGRYLAIEKDMSETSVRKYFAAESYNFWYELIPRVIGSSCQVGRGASYFKKDRQDRCDSDGNCPP